MKRIMISAMQSGGGKTVAACGLMRAYQRRGLAVTGFKCGPDYIDPMFHSRVLGVPSRNLDLFLQGSDGVRRTLARQSGDLAILEGAMGFYDGVNGTVRSSAWELAAETETPAVLVLRPSGQSTTLAAQVRGLMEFRSPSRIAALILTDCKPMLSRHLRSILERETGLPVLGFLPPMEEAVLSSRHLGLVAPGEIADLSSRFDRIADALEQNADLDTLYALAAEGEPEYVERTADALPRCRIGVAMDDAFSFYYADNLDELRSHGAELVFFSPIRDAVMPEVDGLYLGGGYPELHIEPLSGNESMRTCIRDAVLRGMPVVAECGGFLYLQKSLRDGSGREWPMAGALPGQGYPTGSLRRFGYLTLTAEADSLLFRAGEQIPAHEFHYWDSTDCGAGIPAKKENGQNWRCGFLTETMYAAFPHLHWGGSIPMARRFVDAAAGWKEKHG